MSGFTDADVQLVAEAVWQKLKDTDFPNLSGPPTAACFEDARAILTALADAGRLTPPAAEVVEEWTYGEEDEDGVFQPKFWDHIFDTRGEAEALRRGNARIARREVVAGPWVAADGTP